MVQKTFNRRVFLSALLFIAISFYFVFKLFTLHFSDKITISDKSRTEIIRRGYIKDGRGYILAVSIESSSIYANPFEIESPETVAAKISPVLSMTEEYILSRISRSKRFIWLKRKVDDSTAARIKDLNLKGIYIKKEYQRVYPHGNLASNVIGFTDIDNFGIEGIEYKYNDILSGKNQVAYSDDNRRYQYGDNVVLTIDRFVQYVSAKYLAEAVNNLHAKQGAVIVMDVHNGRVLAYAKYPDYDPNNYSRFSYENRKSYAAVDSYEPGSTMKIFSAAAYVTSPKTDIKKKFMSSASIEIAGTTIRSTAAKGIPISIFEAVAYSCNVAVIQAIKDVEAERLYQTLRNFGFGEKTGQDFSGESEGILRSTADWSGLSKYSISIGQEVSVTVFQLAAAYSAIANGGVYYETALVDSIENYSGGDVRKFYPRARGRVVPEDRCLLLQQMLKMVVDIGTGKNARTQYYLVAGKTGTAQKSRSSGGYIEGKLVASFAGYAPYNDPDVCVVVVLDEPVVSTHGGDAAAPVFSKIVNDILPYRGVTSTVVKEVPPKDMSFSNVQFDGSKCPDFTGKDLADSLETIRAIQDRFAIDPVFVGSGTVYKQSPEAGTPLLSGSSIVLYFK